MKIICILGVGKESWTVRSCQQIKGQHCKTLNEVSSALKKRIKEETGLLMWTLEKHFMELKFDPGSSSASFSSTQVFEPLSLTVGGSRYPIFGSGTKLFVTSKKSDSGLYFVKYISAPSCVPYVPDLSFVLSFNQTAFVTSNVHGSCTKLKVFCTFELDLVLIWLSTLTPFFIFEFIPYITVMILFAKATVDSKLSSNDIKSNKT